jgi:hypothetical protein
VSPVASVANAVVSVVNALAQLEPLLLPPAPE